MLNRIIRFLVVLVCVIITLPAAALTPITYLLFNYSLVESVCIIGANAIGMDSNWNYKTFLNAIK